MGQPPGAGRFPGIDGRGRQSRRRPLRRQDPLYQRGQQPLGRLRLRRASGGPPNGRHRHPGVARPGGARQGMCGYGLCVGRSRESAPDRTHGVTPRHPYARTWRNDRPRVAAVRAHNAPMIPARARQSERPRKQIASEVFRFKVEV